MIKSQTKLLFVFLIIIITSTGCSPLVKIEQPVWTDFTSLLDESSVGQSFVARYDGLEKLAIYMKPGTPGDGSILLHLRSSPTETSDLDLVTRSLNEVTAPGYYRFRFSTRKDSANQDFYLHLEIMGEGSVQVANAPGDTYLNGALYKNGIPQDAQLTFRLIYEPTTAFLGLLTEGGFWLVLLITAVFLYILPGWALLSMLFSNWGSLSLGEKIGLSGGVSVAIYPLFILWTDLIGLHLGSLYAWVPPTIACIYLLWKNRSHLNFSIKRINIRPSHGSDLAYFVVIGLIIFVRFWSIRNLDAPMWGDSYQHTLITQLLVDNGGLFESWKPYADLSTFTYHFGFHALAAVFHWATRMALPQTVLWTGQILNVLAVISLYPLAMRISRSRWAGVAAVLIAGLLSPMPMFYLNWGRYTQLAGQVILASIVIVTWDTFEAKTNNLRMICLSCIALGGLALTHYRVLIFAVLFFATYFLLFSRKGYLQTLLVRIFWIGIGAGLLFLPRFVKVFAGRILDIAAAQMTTPPDQASDFLRQYNTIGDIFVYLPVVLWLLMILAIGWGLWRRDKGAALISLWWGLALLATNPQWFDLPGAGLISNFHLFIAAYFPASVLIGGATGWLVPNLPMKYNKLQKKEGVGNEFGPIWMSILLLLVIGTGLWGTRKRMSDLHVSQHALVTRPDVNAANWIQENTPQDSRFLVNSFFAYGGTSIVGSDAGWWLPLLSQRQTTLPPLNYVSEASLYPDNVERINTLTAEIQTKGVVHPDVLNLLKARGVTHAYIGQRQGKVNGPGPLLLLEQLLADAHFRSVYHQDRVWIFEIIP